MPIHLQNLFTPFSQEILDAVIPNTFAGPKVVFTGMEDPETHLAAFHTQMVLVGGSDAAKCKLFMSTLTGWPWIGSSAFQMVISHLSANCHDCSGNNT